MADRAVVIAVLAVVGMVVTIVSLLAYVGIARALSIPLVDASLGFGPKLLQTRLLGVPLTVRPILFGCYVRPWPLPSEASPEDLAADEAIVPAGLPLASRVLPLRAAFAALPLLATLVLAAIVHRGALPALLGQDAVAVLRGALSPFAHARGTLSAAAELGKTQGSLALGLRLLPVFVLSQLSAVSSLSALIVRPGSGAPAALVGAPMLGLFVLMLAWLLAIATWLAA